MDEKLVKLRKRLLTCGGESVPVLNPKRTASYILEMREIILRDQTTDDLIDGKGRVWSYPPIKRLRGTMGECHTNSARRWLKSYPKLHIGTGWALMDADNMWCQHSWIVKAGDENVIYETTMPFDCYFGVVLSPERSVMHAIGELGFEAVEPILADVDPELACRGAMLAASRLDQTGA